MLGARLGVDGANGFAQGVLAATLNQPCQSISSIDVSTLQKLLDRILNLLDMKIVADPTGRHPTSELLQSLASLLARMLSHDHHGLLLFRDGLLDLAGTCELHRHRKKTVLEQLADALCDHHLRGHPVN